MTSRYRRRRVSLNSLLSGLFINDIYCHLAIYLLIFNNSSTSQKDKYVLLHLFIYYFFCEPKCIMHNVSAFKDQLGEIKLV